MKSIWSYQLFYNKKKQRERIFAIMMLKKPQARLRVNVLLRLQLTLAYSWHFFLETRRKPRVACVFWKSGLSATLAERIFSWLSRSAWQSASAECTPHAWCDRKTTTTRMMTTTTTRRPDVTRSAENLSPKCSASPRSTFFSCTAGCLHSPRVGY